MTEQEFEDYYADLLILQYKTLPKARATISALVKQAVDGGFLLKLVNAFGIDRAVGKQLDTIGKYIGLNRVVKVMIGNTNTNVLTDEDYRLLLKLKLICNTNFSSTSQIRSALYELFPSDIRLFDNRDMTYDYQLSTEFNQLVNVILAEELLPFPMGVGYTVAVVPNLLELYGYSDYGGLNDNPNGFSSYTDGFRGRFLSYGDKFASEE